jgi:hypothetical protein
MRHGDRPRALRPSGTWCIALAAVCAGELCFAAAGEEPNRNPKRLTPTYTRDVLPILQKSCQNCHRRDHVGQFALQTYEQTRKRAFDIAAVAGDRTMPPWKPVAGFGPRLKHDPSLTKREVAVLDAWAEAGAPRGEEKDSPGPRDFPNGWTLGTPDLILEMTEDFHVPPAGPDLYRCFVIPTNLKRDTYVSAVEYRPGNLRVVHHMMAFLDSTGAGRERDAAEQGPGYTSYSGAGVEVEADLGGWAAGNVAQFLPEGIGRPVPARSDVLLQVHYHPSGKPEVDRTRLGIYFCKKPVRQTLHWANATNDKFRLQPGQRNIEVRATWSVPIDVEALAVTPHMHQLGRDFRMTAVYPGGKNQDLLHIDAWDPNWQNTYFFEHHVPLPKGSTVKIVAHYDNSSHARNPNDPPKLVTWGPEATDEMCVGYIGVVKKGQDLTRPGEKDDLFEILARQHLRRTAREQAARNHGSQD